MTTENERISVKEYALRLAETAALRSEDPHVKVGACAMDKDFRVIALAYNGLPQGMKVESPFWDDRDLRLKYVLHAEQNLCSLFKRGDVKFVATTLQPCPSCFRLLVAHGVQQIVYRLPYLRDDADKVVAELSALYGVGCDQLIEL